MSEELKEECAVAAVYGHPEAALQVFECLYALQHRGQEGAGIAAGNGAGAIKLGKGRGHVNNVFSPAKIMSRLPGFMAIGHDRYSTQGGDNSRNVQPFLAKSPWGEIALGHNGQITNAEILRRKLLSRGAKFETSSDSEVILQLLVHSEQKSFVEAAKESFGLLEGAFSVVILHPEGVLAARDPWGFRPLVLGEGVLKNEQTYQVVASETCALDLLRAAYINEVEPGEVVSLSAAGTNRFYFAEARVPLARCVFEYVYFSRPDSIVFGKTVADVRQHMGRLLAQKDRRKLKADITVPVPDSGIEAAQGYAAASGIPCLLALKRNHYVGRTFIQPSQVVRDYGVRLKLNPVKSQFKNKRVVLVDDSIVRGTTSRKIVRMVRQAGAREVHLRISCPPTVSPCFYGVDTPEKNELIAANHSVDEIRRFVEADSLAYLSLGDLLKASGGKERDFCTACYTENYPILPSPLVSIAR